MEATLANVNEIPSDDEVVAVLERLGGRTDAMSLCRALVDEGHPVAKSQLAIQRATDRQRLILDRDWTLSVARQAVAA